jgi:GT2 family glycosyltransferase
MLTSIVVAYVDLLEYTTKCINTIQKSKLKHEIEIILIDAGSKEKETNAKLKEYFKKYKNIRYVLPEIKLSFSQSMNLGLSLAKGEYIILMNNDVEIGENTLYNLVENCNRLNGFVGMHGHILKYEDPNMFGFKKIVKQNYPFEVDYLGMSLMCGRKSMWNTVGPVDNEYKIGYCEDTDYGLRAQIKGISSHVICCDGCKHEGGATMNKVPNLEYYRAMNIKRFMNKWGDYLKTRNGH